MYNHRQPTEREIAKRIKGEYAQCMFFPNVYGLSHFNESDLLRVTKRGYVYEYEIKHSIRDLRADRRKKKKHWTYQYCFEHKLRPKDTSIMSKGHLVPKQFWYVFALGENQQRLTGEQVQELIPPYAGLMYAFCRRPRYAGSGEDILHCGLNTIRGAPELSKEKLGDKLLPGLMEKMYYKYWEYIA